MFFLPNLLIYYFIKNENLKLIYEISNIVYSLILSLSTNLSIKDSLLISVHTVKYQRLRKSYKKFIDDYLMYNLNMQRGIEEFSKKFNSYEFNMFLSVLTDADKEGNMIEGLEIFSQTLEAMYFKYLRYKSSKNFLFVSLATVVSLINIFLLVGYPMIVQISSGFKNLFM